MPFVVDKLPATFDKETNNTLATAQKITPPLLINGRIDRPDDWDVFQFAGKSNDMVAVEVQARSLDSPLDSVVKLTDAAGKVLAFSDDREDLGAGLHTHHADSWFMARLPTNGVYYVHIGDTGRKGSDEHAYRLRISAPQPDFELRVMPSSASLRTNATAAVTVYAQRQDGFAGPIKLELKEPPAGFSAAPVTLAAGQNNTRLTIKGPPDPTKNPVRLSIVGSAKIGEKDIVRQAVPAEDRMQAFLWRHLVPARDLRVLVFDPGYQLPPKRVARARPPSAVLTNAAPIPKVALVTNVVAATNAGAKAVGGTNAATVAAAKPKFTKQQVASRLRQLKLLYEDGLLTDDFFDERVAECEAAQ
jgi:hypothetical protein